MKGMKEEEECLRLKKTIEEEEETAEEVVAEEEVVEEEVVDIEEDVNALLGGEELSEEFKEKAKTIFEAAINAPVLLEIKGISGSSSMQLHSAEEVEEDQRMHSLKAC